MLQCWYTPNNKSCYLLMACCHDLGNTATGLKSNEWTFGSFRDFFGGGGRCFGFGSVLRVLRTASPVSDKFRRKREFFTEKKLPKKSRGEERSQRAHWLLTTGCDHCAQLGKVQERVSFRPLCLNALTGRMFYLSYLEVLTTNLLFLGQNKKP